MNKYLEKIASFKGFMANAKGMREAGLETGASRSDYAKELLKLRSRAHAAKKLGHPVEMEPGYSEFTRDSVRTFNKMKNTDVLGAINHMRNMAQEGPKKFPKAYETLNKLEDLGV